MPKTVLDFDELPSLLGTDVLYGIRGTGLDRDRQFTVATLLEHIRGVYVENFVVSAGGGDDELELTTDAPLSIIRCTGGAAHPVQSGVKLAGMSSIPVGGIVLILNHTANFLRLTVSATAPEQPRVVGCGPSNAMIVFKDINDIIRAYAFDDDAWRAALVVPDDLPLASVFAENVHSAGVVQAVSTLVAAGSFMRARPLNYKHTAFELLLDLRFNADASRANLPVAFRFDTGLPQGPWKDALYDLIGTDTGIMNGYVATPAQPGLTPASFFLDTVNVGNYGIVVSTRTWTDLLTTSGAGRMFGIFRVEKD